jgi:cellobiose transport system permease protein
MTATAPDALEQVEDEVRPERNKAAYLGRSPQDTPAGWVNYVLLSIAVFISAWPIYWMGVMSGSSESAITHFGPPQLVPEGWGRFMFNYNLIMGNTTEVNYPSYTSVHFFHSMMNSVIVVLVVTAGSLFFCSLAGFAFAKLRFVGRDPLFVFVVLTMTIPAQLGIVGAYLIWEAIGGIDTLFAVIVPALVSAFGVFYMRQFIEDSIPDEIIESARVDGASTFRVFRSIVVPVIRPALGVLGLITVIGVWNEYIWALVAVGGSDAQTIGPALHNLRAGNTLRYSIIITGTFLATLPLVILLIVTGKQIVAGIMEGAVKT